MLNFFSTLGADSQFQKNRLILTKPNHQAPNEQALKSILHTFAGEDEQTRSQIAFACIMKKIHVSASKDNWLYLIKNLIILDKVMSQNLFCQQIVSTTLLTVQNYIEKDSKSSALNAKKLLKVYWQLIQEMCQLKISKKHILYYKRSERKSYLQSTQVHQILAQIQVLQKVFDDCLSLIFLTSGVSNKMSQSRIQKDEQKNKKVYHEFVATKLAQYLNIHFYSKLLTFFSCQYLCIHKFIQIILHTAKKDEYLAIEDAKQFKKTVYKFKNICNNMVMLAEKSKNKKGFEHIEVKQFSTFQEEHIIRAVDDYIQQNSRVSSLERSTIIQSIRASDDSRNGFSQTFVDRKPLRLQKKMTEKIGNKCPRKTIQCKIGNAFQDQVFVHYDNSYSEDFPHKNMMTLDLIQDIRKDQAAMIKSALKHGDSTFQIQKQSHENAFYVQQRSFMKQIKHLRLKLKCHNILVFGKDIQIEQEREESTNYSYKNSSRGRSLVDLFTSSKIGVQQQSQI